MLQQTISSLSQNAVLAKARAMYADILTRADYDRLAACRTVGEAANYLKTHTAYGETIAALPNVKFHRARLEATLKRYMLTRVGSLCGFEKAIGQPIHRILLYKYEIDYILLCADYLDSDSVGVYSIDLPAFFQKHSALNPTALERARKPSDLVTALQGTHYAPIAEKAVNGQTEFSVQVLENALYADFYARGAEIIRGNFGKKEQEELLDCFRLQADVKMIESVYRLKKYFPQSSGGFFDTSVTAFTEAQREALRTAQSADEVLKILQGSCYGRYFPAAGVAIEQRTQAMELRINEKNIRFSTRPEAVMLSYIGILENEIRNITHIIEGIRYSLSAEEIAEYLVL